MHRARRRTPEWGRRRSRPGARGSHRRGIRGRKSGPNTASSVGPLPRIPASLAKPLSHNLERRTGPVNPRRRVPELTHQIGVEPPVSLWRDRGPQCHAPLRIENRCSVAERRPAATQPPGNVAQLSLDARELLLHSASARARPQTSSSSKRMRSPAFVGIDSNNLSPVTHLAPRTDITHINHRQRRLVRFEPLAESRELSLSEDGCILTRQGVSRVSPTSSKGN